MRSYERPSEQEEKLITDLEKNFLKELTRVTNEDKIEWKDGDNYNQFKARIEQREFLVNLEHKGMTVQMYGEYRMNLDASVFENDFQEFKKAVLDQTERLKDRHRGPMIRINIRKAELDFLKKL